MESEVAEPTAGIDEIGSPGEYCVLPVKWGGIDRRRRPSSTKELRSREPGNHLTSTLPRARKGDFGKRPQHYLR